MEGDIPQLDGQSLREASVSVSAQDGIVALGKNTHTRSATPLSSRPKVSLETVLMFVW